LAFWFGNNPTLIDIVYICCSLEDNWHDNSTIAHVPCDRNVLTVIIIVIIFFNILMSELASKLYKYVICMYILDLLLYSVQLKSDRGDCAESAGKSHSGSSLSFH